MRVTNGNDVHEAGARTAGRTEHLHATKRRTRQAARARRLGTIRAKRFRVGVVSSSKDIIV